jgi:hypothetical protein
MTFLKGEWEGNDAEGNPVPSSFKPVISGNVADRTPAAFAELHRRVRENTNTPMRNPRQIRRIGLLNAKISSVHWYRKTGRVSFGETLIVVPFLGFGSK